MLSSRNFYSSQIKNKILFKTKSTRYFALTTNFKNKYIKNSPFIEVMYIKVDTLLSQLNLNKGDILFIKFDIECSEIEFNYLNTTNERDLIAFLEHIP